MIFIEILKICAKYIENHETAQESRPSVSYVRPPGSIYDSEALLVISDRETDRIDPGNWFKIDSVYPLFPPGTKPFQQKRPRRQHQPERQLRWDKWALPNVGLARKKRGGQDTGLDRHA